MKITAIVSSQTNSKQTAFRTEPPLTEEVLGCALRDFWGENWANVYSAARGLFIVARTAIPKEQIPEYERTLSEAEKLIQKRKENAKKTRDDFLKGAIAEKVVPRSIPTTLRVLMLKKVGRMPSFGAGLLVQFSCPRRGRICASCGV
jgi:hypothetical protein